MNEKLQGRPAHKNPKGYPWKKWFNRSKKLILKSEDYTATQKSMCVMVRIQARLHGVKVGVFPKKDGSIEIVPKTVTSISNN